MTKLSLQEILDNAPRELEVAGIGTVLVRDPTIKDRIDSREEAKKDPRWSELSDQERNALVLDLLAIKMIVEPRITMDDYYNANSVVLSNVINAVIMDYTLRFRKLQDKRSREIQSFLEAMREDSQKSSTIS